MYENEENFISNVIIKAINDQLSQMRAYYRFYLLSKQIPYTNFAAKRDGTTITAYTSGKVIFQGTNAAIEVDKWGEAQDKQAKLAKTASSLPKNTSQLSVLGSDEAGNGSYLGPLTVYAAYVKCDQLAELRKPGIRDSKESEDSQVIWLADILKKTIPCKLLVLSPEKYNEIQPKYNVVWVKVALHNQATHLLLKKIEPEKPEAILIDQFTPEANSKKYVRLEKNQSQEELYFVTKRGQYYLAIAAAPIISHASFLEELHKAPAEAGITFPSGAGTRFDQAAIKLLEKGGMPMPEKYAGFHFANTEKALKLLKE